MGNKLRLKVGGSLTNRLLEAGTQATSPEVGMGGTIVSYSDRHACTVVEVLNGGKEVVVQLDTAIRTDGNRMSDSQSYRFERNESAPKHRFTLRKTGQWIRPGESLRSYGDALVLGHRDEHYDYCF